MKKYHFVHEDEVRSYLDRKGLDSNRATSIIDVLRRETVRLYGEPIPRVFLVNRARLKKMIADRTACVGTTAESIPEKVMTIGSSPFADDIFVKIEKVVGDNKKAPLSRIQRAYFLQKIKADISILECPDGNPWPVFDRFMEDKQDLLSSDPIRVAAFIRKYITMSAATMKRPQVDDGNRTPSRYDLPAGCGGVDITHWVRNTPFFYGCLIKYVWRGWDSLSDMMKALDCASRVWSDMENNNSVYWSLSGALSAMAKDVCVLNDIQYSSYEHRQALALASSGKLDDIKQLFHMVFSRTEKNDHGARSIIKQVQKG